MLRCAWQADCTHLTQNVISTHKVWTNVVRNAIVDVGVFFALDYTIIIMYSALNRVSRASPEHWDYVH